MKKLAFITLIAACIFGVNTQSANATHTNEDVVIQLSGGGEISTAYDEESQTIKLRMKSGQNNERVSITLKSQSGFITFKEQIAVSNRGTEFDISMERMNSGIYMLEVEGATISFRGRYMKK